MQSAVGHLVLAGLPPMDAFQHHSRSPTCLLGSTLIVACSDPPSDSLGARQLTEPLSPALTLTASWSLNCFGLDQLDRQSSSPSVVTATALTSLAFHPTPARTNLAATSCVDHPCAEAAYNLEPSWLVDHLVTLCASL